MMTTVTWAGPGLQVFLNGEPVGVAEAAAKLARDDAERALQPTLDPSDWPGHVVAVAEAVTFDLPRFARWLEVDSRNKCRVGRGRRRAIRRRQRGRERAGAVRAIRKLHRLGVVGGMSVPAMVAYRTVGGGR